MECIFNITWRKVFYKEIIDVCEPYIVLVIPDIPHYISLFPGNCLYSQLIKPLQFLFQNNRIIIHYSANYDGNSWQSRSLWVLKWLHFSLCIHFRGWLKAWYCLHVYKWNMPMILLAVVFTTIMFFHIMCNLKYFYYLSPYICFSWILIFIARCLNQYFWNYFLFGQGRQMELQQCGCFCIWINILSVVYQNPFFFLCFSPMTISNFILSTLLWASSVTLS